MNNYFVEFWIFYLSLDILSWLLSGSAKHSGTLWSTFPHQGNFFVV